MRSLRNTIEVMSDSSVLTYCGFTLDPPSTCWSDNHQHPEHPQVDMENELATNMGDLVTSLIVSRLRKFMWLLRAWPANSIRFTSDVKEAAKAGATVFKKDFEALQEGLKEAHKPWRKTSLQTCSPSLTEASS